MATSYTLASEADLFDSRAEVMKWLRAPTRYPDFLRNVPDGKLAIHHEEIAQKLVGWVPETEFNLEVVSLDENGMRLFEGRWTHKGADFVGFKQPAAALNRNDAVILACAALLRNDWCRSRLPNR